MSREPIAAVRALTSAFSTVEFAAFRDALTDAASLEDVAASVDRLGPG